MLPGQDEEIALDSEVAGVIVTLQQLAEAPLPPPPLLPATGFAPDEWAAELGDGRVLAFLREPARCHFDRLLLIDGERRVEHPLPAWLFYGQLVAPGPRGALLVGGARNAWRLDADGTMTTVLAEPDGETVHVAWRGQSAVAAGWTSIVIDGPDGRVVLPCNHGVGVCVLDSGLVIVSDDNGSQWIDGDRVVARDWRQFLEARGDVTMSVAGEAYQVRVTRG